MTKRKLSEILSFIGLIVCAGGVVGLLTATWLMLSHDAAYATWAFWSIIVAFMGLLLEGGSVSMF